MSIDDEWQHFLDNNNNNNNPHKIFDDDNDNDEDDDYDNITSVDDEMGSKRRELYISTKSKIVYLSETEVDIYKIFWGLPILPYATPKEGVVKKQIKINCASQQETDENNERLSKVGLDYLNEDLNANRKTQNIKLLPRRSVYRDIRKVSIGISKKDILSNKTKKKSAFFNCVVIYLRLLINDVFKEFHIKLFNTGKVELPGIKNDLIFDIVLDKLVVILIPYMHPKITIDKNNVETILINSDFNCGFFIKRDRLKTILLCKYNIPCIYDPCTYQGIKCKKEFIVNGKKVVVNFMIFRTGSVLVVGKCVEETLYEAYEIIKNILDAEVAHIRQPNANETVKSKHDKIGKVVKKRKLITKIESFGR